MNVEIIYDLDNLLKTPLRNFALKIPCLASLFTNIAKNSDKSKWMYSGYGLAFDGESKASLGNESARNVVICGIDNSSPSHINNRKNDYLVLGERDTFGINESFGAPEKILVLILVKQRQIWLEFALQYVTIVIFLLYFLSS